MTQHNLTEILKVIRDLVMRNRPCYRDYLGNGQYKTKLLPEYLLPTFLRQDVVATKTEVQSAADNATAAADAAQTTANNCVSFSLAQSLTDTQKQLARTNIGAGTSSFGGNYDDLILSSSTANSTKRFRITVDDTGTLSATEVT